MTNKRYQTNGTTTVSVVCAIVFCLFSFLYLYAYQSDVMAVAQHQLSQGATSYNRFIGASLITFVLLLIKWWVAHLLRLNGRLHALSYFPSALLLTLICDYRVDHNAEHYLYCWTWLAPLSLLVWLGISIFLRKVMDYDSRAFDSSLFSRSMWINLSVIGWMCFAVATISGTDDAFHFRAHTERLLQEGKFEEAARVGQESLVTDPHLTMLRAYALSRRGELGEAFFRYPVVGGSNALLPTTGEASCLMLPADSIFRHVGAKPLHPTTVLRFIRTLQVTRQATRAVADYHLCALLADRNLKEFVRQLPRYYTVNDSLPRHYREALVLYVHLTAHPSIVYHESVMETDYEDMQKMERECPKAEERMLKIYKHYFGTYWWYFTYAKDFFSRPDAD